MIAYAINYAGHVVYSDGRLYKNGEFVGQYRSASQAKAAATMHQKKLVQEATARHYTFMADTFKTK